MRVFRITLSLFCAWLTGAQPGPMLYDFEGGFNLASAKAFGSTLALEVKDGNTALSVVPKDAAAWEGVTLAFPARDLSAHVGLLLTVRNTGSRSLTVFADADDNTAYPSCKGAVRLDPGRADTLYVQFHRESPPAYLASWFTGMRGLPGGYTGHWEFIDPAKLSQVQVSVFNPGPGAGFVIDDVRAWGDFAPPSEAVLQAGFFPLLDTLGQYRHAEWPGKTRGQADLEAQAAEEAADLALHPGPADWNAYGGWKAGPQLEATGRFRVQKVDGKWWLVDPDGRLFWSQGITCVNTFEATPTAGRERYFTAIPANGNFRGANLKRKFGAAWSAKAADQAHQRLRSWGVNTFGNWSDRGIYALQKTPYTVYFASGLPQDVPASMDTAAFRAEARSNLAALKTQIAGDPWCLGVFSDNEMRWPAATAAVLGEDYYRILSQEIKASLPGLLYLGSRIHNAPEAVWRAAGKYCDVISHNRYDYILDGMPLPADVDKPVMLTEFHFGALDRGLPHPGLRPVFNQAQRARAYAGLVAQCLAHPNLVGAHWFQYSDQVYTGRSDGENYQIGFVDVCDRPYPEMTAAARSLSGNLYATRMPGAISAHRPAGNGPVPPGPFPGIRVDALGRKPRVRPLAEAVPAFAAP